MDNKKIIAILCVIIVILLVCLAVMFFSKEKTSIEVSNETLSVGDSMTVSLTDSKGNPIADKTVSIRLKQKGEETSIDRNVTTNSNGKATLKLEQAGDYEVEVKFDGDDKYRSSSVNATLKVKEKQASTATHTSKYASDGSIYPEYGPAVDSQGITREYAIAHNMHYIEMILDDGQVVGGYVEYDPAAGCYHT